jgi:AAA+ ATPase superfamily predicted ATPase
VVIDEFSYAVDADPSLPSVIQRLWDEARRNMTKACFIFCTSFTEAVERHFTVDGPLYRRRTRQLPVKPFSYRDAMLFFPRWSLLDRLQAWGIVGGVPSYLQALQGETRTAVTEHILEKTAVLYTEAEVLLGQEVRGVGPALLRAMLAAIAYGCTEPNEIGQRVGRPVTSLSGALRFLVDYGLLTRRVPFTVANSERTRSTHYYLADNYLAFWFRFVLPNRSMLEQGQAAAVWRTRIAPNFSTYMGMRFEDACRQFIHLQPHRWAHQICDLGVWWRGNDELEIVGLDADQVVLVAEAKWTNEPVGLEILRNVQRRVALLPRVAPDHQLALFAKEGFTDAVRSLQGPTLALYTAAAMLA